MLGQRLGRIHHIVVGRLLGPYVQGVDPVRAQRVVVEEAVLAGIGEHFLVAEVVEEIDEAAGGHVRLFQEGGGRLVGGGLLGARIAVIGEGGEVVGAEQQSASRFRRTGRGGQ